MFNLLEALVTRLRAAEANLALIATKRFLGRRPPKGFNNGTPKIYTDAIIFGRLRSSA
jgi:hypothetical protein